MVRGQPTQVGRALSHLGVAHIAAYSPQARGRSERLFQTLQDRLPKELALAGITTMDAANAWLRDSYIPAHNARFVLPGGTGRECVRSQCLRLALAEILRATGRASGGQLTTVCRSSTAGDIFERSPLRLHFVKATVKEHDYPDGGLGDLPWPARRPGRYDSSGVPLGELEPCHHMKVKPPRPLSLSAWRPVLGVAWIGTALATPQSLQIPPGIRSYSMPSGGSSTPLLPWKQPYDP